MTKHRAPRAKRSKRSKRAYAVGGATTDNSATAILKRIGIGALKGGAGAAAGELQNFLSQRRGGRSRRGKGKKGKKGGKSSRRRR